MFQCSDKCPIKYIIMQGHELNNVHTEILESANHTAATNDGEEEHYFKYHYFKAVQLKCSVPFMICLITFFLAKGITLAWTRYGKQKRTEQMHVLGLFDLIFY